VEAVEAVQVQAVQQLLAAAQAQAQAQQHLVELQTQVAEAEGITQVLVVLAGLELFIFAAVLKVMLLLQQEVMVLLQAVQDQLQLRLTM
jgi:hypothetical protein